MEVVAPESEKEAYKSSLQNPILTIPDKYEGLGQVRNWVLDAFNEDTVIMIDDDITRVYNLEGKLSRKIEGEELTDVLFNTAIMAKDAGASVFGFSQTDIRKYKGTEPFGICSWVGCVIGIIGRKHRFRNDKFKVDIDMCLQSLLTERIVWIDNRYYFNQNRDNNAGGNGQFRTEELFRKSVDSLKSKWGAYLKEGKHKNQIRLSLNVKRRQDIKYE